MSGKFVDEPFPKDLLPCIEKFFFMEQTRKPGENLYPAIFDTSVFFPLQRKGELAQMMEMARSVNPKVVMEIGTDKAGGLYHWCKCLPSVERVIACEIRGTPYSKLFEKAFPHIDFLWLPTSSYDPGVVNGVLRWIQPDKIDCLFIDGDKSFFDLDFDCYRPMMRDTGIVFMHDITDEAPGAGYQKVIKRDYKHQEIVDKSDVKIALEREAQGDPPSSAHDSWLRHWRGASCGVGCIFMPKYAGA